jgi:hypothetical protein
VTDPVTGPTVGDGTDGWPAEERQLLDQLRAGSTVVAHLTRHRHLVAWAKAHGRFVRVDRRTAYGNPFHVGTKPGQFTRAEAIDRFTTDVLPGLDVTPLRGMVLGCWCAPRACHGHVLAEAADGTSRKAG